MAVFCGTEGYECFAASAELYGVPRNLMCPPEWCRLVSAGIPWLYDALQLPTHFLHLNPWARNSHHAVISLERKNPLLRSKSGAGWCRMIFACGALSWCSGIWGHSEQPFSMVQQFLSSQRILTGLSSLEQLYLPSLIICAGLQCPAISRVTEWIDDREIIMLSIQDNCHLLSKVCNLIRLPNIPFSDENAGSPGNRARVVRHLSVTLLPNSSPFQPLQIYLSCPETVPLQHRTDANVSLKPPSRTDPPSLLQMLTPACQLPSLILTAFLSQASPPFPACFPAFWIIQGRSIQQLKHKCNRWLWSI